MTSSGLVGREVFAAKRKPAHVNVEGSSESLERLLTRLGDLPLPPRNLKGQHPTLICHFLLSQPQQFATPLDSLVHRFETSHSKRLAQAERVKK